MQRTIFDTPIVNNVFRGLSRLGLKLAGWKLEGKAPASEKYVVIAAPHTSNWDFPLTIAMAFLFEMKIYWMGKDALFNGPMGPMMRWLGGIPVERKAKHGLVQQVVDQFAIHQQLIVVIPPEGTRSKVSKWKSGFYHVAHGASVPIALGYLDFQRKRGGFGPLFETTGDYETDLIEIQKFYAEIKGKRPDQFL